MREHVPDLDVTVVGGPATLIFNLPGGLAGYAIWLRLVALKSGLILPEECQITTEFGDQIVLESFSRRFPLCKLGQCEFRPEEVLNDRFPLKFHRRGHMIEGVILATGLEPIPKQYLQRMRVPFKLAFEDQFGNEISTEAELSVDRTMRPTSRLDRPTSSLHSLEGIPARCELGFIQDRAYRQSIPVTKNEVGKKEEVPSNR